MIKNGQTLRRNAAAAPTQEVIDSLAEAQRIAKLGSWEWLPDTGEMVWSDELFAILGIPRSRSASMDAYRERIHPEDIARVEEEIRANVAGKLTEVRCDFRVRLPDGTVRMIEGRSHVIRDADDRARRLVGTCLDVTEAWAANEALRASEERFRSLIKATAAVQWHTDATGEQVEATATWSEFTGQSAADTATPDGWLEALHPDDRAQAIAQWREAAEGELDYCCEYRLRRRDGVYRNMVSRGVPVRNRDGSVREWIGTCVDVTELNAANEARMQREQEFETLVENVPDIISRYDREYRHLYVNGAAAEATGMPVSAFIGKTHAELGMPPHLQLEWAALLESVFTSGREQETEFRFETPAGARYYQSRLVPELALNGSIRSVLNIARDITERRLAEQALRQSEERYRAMLDQVAVGVCEITFDGTFNRVNPRLCELWGYTADELLKLKFAEITHPEDVARSLQLAEELSQEQRQFFSVEKRYVRKDRRVIWAFSTVSLLRDGHGKPQSMIAIVEDITARKEAEEKLRFHARMLDSAGEAIVATDPDGIAIYLNRHAELLYGWPREEAIGRNILDLLLPPEIATLAQARDVMAELRAGAHAGGEYFLQRRDGSIVRASISVSVITDHAGAIQAIIGICRDVTDLNVAREQLVQSERRLRALTARMESSREEERTRIARAIHDELGQLLTGLKMDLRWVEGWLERSHDERLRPFLDRIVGSSELTDTIIKAVQGIAAELRPGVLDTLGLKSALEYEARRFQERTGRACVIKSSGEMPALSTEVTTALFRIFQECLTNVARHSNASLVEVVLESPDDEVHLCISDNGKGIRDIQRAAEESLGLLGITERVKLLGGIVSFTSDEASGTTIDVRVPRGSDTPSLPKNEHR